MRGDGGRTIERTSAGTPRDAAGLSLAAVGVSYLALGILTTMPLVRWAAAGVGWAEPHPRDPSTGGLVLFTSVSAGALLAVTAAIVGSFLCLALGHVRLGRAVRAGGAAGGVRGLLALELALVLFGLLTAAGGLESLAAHPLAESVGRLGWGAVAAGATATTQGVAVLLLGRVRDESMPYCKSAGT